MSETYKDYRERNFNVKLSDLRDNLFVVQPEYLYLFIEIMISVHNYFPKTILI